MKKKNKGLIITIICVISLILLMILTWSLIYYYTKNSRSDFNQKINEITNNLENAYLEINENFEYGSSFSYDEIINKTLKDDLVENTSITLSTNEGPINENDSIIFNKVGEIPLTITLKNTFTYKIFSEMTKEITSSKTINLNVVDTKYPILKGVENKTITAGDSLNILEGITATDEVDGELTVEKEGEVNLDKAGTYTIKIYAVDKNCNRSEQEMIITVQAKKTTKPSTSNSSSTQSSGSSNQSSSSSSNNNSSSNNGSTSTQTSCKFTDTLKKRGYKKADPDACKKDQEASAIAQKIANEILAKGYKTDIEKVEAAAVAVASNYDWTKHVESGFDYRTAYGVFVTHSASCAGCTRALILVLEYMGFKNLVHANENGYTHQWVILTMDGKKGFADGQIGMVGYGCHMVDDTCTE